MLGLGLKAGTGRARIKGTRHRESKHVLSLDITLVGCATSKSQSFRTTRRPKAIENTLATDICLIGISPLTFGVADLGEFWRFAKAAPSDEARRNAKKNLTGGIHFFLGLWYAVFEFYLIF